jgi:secreted trypsin-like serine protease
VNKLSKITNTSKILEKSVGSPFLAHAINPHPTDLSRIMNFIFLIVIIFCTIFQTKAVSADNKESLVVEEKIINGKPSEAEAWPWMVAISSTTTTGRSSFCGGSLIAPQWVLTAAHCVKDRTSKILIHKDNVRGPMKEYIPVTHSVIHPDYDDKTKTADLALLHIGTPSSITPLSLTDDFNFQNEEGNLALAIGWGLIQQGLVEGEKEVQPVKLHQVELPLISDSACNYSVIPGNTICIGIFDEKAVCSGDSGGPLIIFDTANQRWKQIGITSLGLSENCIAEGEISVFTQVDKYKQFIDLTIHSTQESPEDFLAKCANKYPEFVGQKIGTAYPCGNAEICLDTSGGQLMDIRQLSVLKNNENEILDFLDVGTQKWHKISFSDIGYCE